MTNRTALFNRTQPGGVYTVQDMLDHPGDIWFVDSGHSAAVNGAGYGRNPDAPFATLDYAIANCTASNGDVIFVMPGHAENLAADSAVDIDVIGLKIIGLGWGSSRPTFTCTAAAGDFKLAAASTWVQNILFLNDVDNSTGMVEVSAADCKLINCEWRESDAAKFADVLLLTTAAADRLEISGCTFIGNAADGAVSAIELVGADHCWIHDCYIKGNFDTGAIQCITTPSLLIRIHDCKIWQLDDTAGAAGVQMILDTVTTSTGIIGPRLELVGIVNAANITEAVTGATFNLIDPVYVVNLVNEKAMLIDWAVTTDA